MGIAFGAEHFHETGEFASGDGEVIIYGGTFGFNPTTWVADGYQAVYDSVAKTWTVSAI